MFLDFLLFLTYYFSIQITVIQVYAPTSNAEEAEVEQFYEDLQDLLELTPQKYVLFIIGDWNAEVGSRKDGRMWCKLITKPSTSLYCLCSEGFFHLRSCNHPLLASLRVFAENPIKLGLRNI